MPSTILVVDDNKKIVDVLVEYLQSDGYSVVQAYDGASALEVAEQQPIDLALLDIMLPEVNGLEVAKSLIAKDMPVILVTARVEEVDRLIGLGIGADDYITKPFSPREVVARVRAVLKRYQRVQPASQVITLEDLTVDLESRMVSVGGRNVNLTRTEFDILVHMIQAPGRVFTRAQIIRITGADYYEGYERSVDAHIKNLRKKLCPTGERDYYIKTAIGVGYRMDKK